MRASRVAPVSRGTDTPRVTRLARAASWAVSLALALAAAAASGEATLVSSWRAEGDASDALGLNHGLEQGSVGYAPGALGEAFSLDGSGFIGVPNPPYDDYVEAFSVAAWIEISAYSDGAPVLNFRNTENGFGFTLEQRYETPGTLMFAVNRFGGNNGFSNVSAPGWQLGTLYHVAATFEARTGTLALYRDGVAVAAWSDYPGLPMTTGRNAEFEIGHNIAIGTFWRGAIDEACFFDGALSEEEVAALASLPADPCGPSAGPEQADVVLLPVAPQPGSGQYQLESTWANAINNAGVIVGGHYWHPLAGPKPVRWYWPTGTVEVLGELEGWVSNAVDVNDEGHIAGRMWVDPTFGTGWLLRDGELLEASTYLDRGSWSVAVNARGRMAVNFPPPFLRAYRWRAPHHFREVKLPSGVPSHGSTEATDINDAGHIVGYSRHYPDEDGPVLPVDLAFWWDGSGRADALDSLGGRRSQAHAVNQFDDVAGESELAPGVGGGMHAVLWTQDDAVDLGTLGGLNSSASDLDGLGNVVGSSELDVGSDERRAFLWRDGEMLDLNRMIQPGWAYPLIGARGMNDQGQIVCDADTPQGPRAALVTLWARDVTAKVRVNVGPVRRQGRRVSQDVFLENTGGSPIEGPISLILDDLEGGTLTRSDGTTGEVRPPAGSPYLTGDGPLAAGGRRSAMRFKLQYASVSAAGVSFTPRVVAGVGRR